MVKLESMRDHHSEHLYRAKSVKHDENYSAPSPSGDAATALVTFVQVARNNDRSTSLLQRPALMQRLSEVNRALRQSVEANFPLYESKERTFVTSPFQNDDAQTISDLHDYTPRGHHEAWLLNFYGINVDNAKTLFPRRGDPRRDDPRRVTVPRPPSPIEDGPIRFRPRQWGTPYDDAEIISLQNANRPQRRAVTFRECYNPNTMTAEDIAAEIDTKKQLYNIHILNNESSQMQFATEQYFLKNVPPTHFLFDPATRRRMTFFYVHISYRYDSPDITLEKQNAKRLQGAANLMWHLTFYVRRLTYSFHLSTSSVFPFQFTNFQESVIRSLFYAATRSRRRDNKLGCVLSLEMHTNDTVDFPNETELATAFDGVNADWCFAATVEADTFSFTGATARYFNAFWNLTHEYFGSDIQYELSVARRPLDNKINAIILALKF